MLCSLTYCCFYERIQFLGKKNVHHLRIYANIYLWFCQSWKVDRF